MSAIFCIYKSVRVRQLSSKEILVVLLVFGLFFCICIIYESNLNELCKQVKRVIFKATSLLTKICNHGDINSKAINNGNKFRSMRLKIKPLMLREWKINGNESLNIIKLFLDNYNNRTTHSNNDDDNSDSEKQILNYLVLSRIGWTMFEEYFI